MNKAIFFDFDGVIVDSFSFCYEINKQNIPDLTEQGFRDKFNGNVFEGLKAVGINKGTGVKFDFWAAYTPELNKQAIRTEISSLIRELHGKYNLFIISSTISSAIVNFLEYNKIPGCFKEVLGSDVHKNKDYKVNLILDKYHLEPKDCLFVTDTVGDVLEARKCDVRSVAVTWGFHDRDTLVTANPEAIANNPAELLLAIKDLLN
jgi:phosphoglycolate phosphatase